MAPLSPHESAASLLSRTLVDPGLHAFIEKTGTSAGKVRPSALPSLARFREKWSTDQQEKTESMIRSVHGK
jgi:hypothetical protein